MWRWRQAAVDTLQTDELRSEPHFGLEAYLADAGLARGVIRGGPACVCASTCPAGKAGANHQAGTRYQAAASGARAGRFAASHGGGASSGNASSYRGDANRSGIGPSF